MSASVLFEGDLVILGETRVPAHEPEFRREAVAEVWPNVAFPRAPLGIRPEDGPLVLGDLNTAILFPVGRAYRRVSIAGSGSWTEWIEVRPDVVEDLACEHALPFRAGGAPAPGPAYLAHRGLRAMLRKDGPLDAFALEERALAIACEVIRAGFALHGSPRRAPSPAAERARRRAVYEVQALLNQRLADPLPLSAISRAVEVSPYHLCRVFRETTGLPIHRYRDRLRVRASLDRLCEKDATVLEVALDLGYANEAHFSDAFRRAFGVRPGAYRRTRRGDSRI
jgi:AraC-like DNA-binding protein